MYGDLIRVLPGVYKDRPELSALTGRPHLWVTFFPAKAAASRGIVRVVGTYPIEPGSAAFPLFRIGGLPDPKTHAIGRWSKWDGAATRPIERMRNEEWALPPLETINDTLLIERILSDWRPEHEAELESRLQAGGPVAAAATADSGAKEFLASRAGDPRFIARQHENGAREAENRSSYQNAAAPLLRDLAKLGYVVPTIGALRHGKRRYSDAVPLLARWLPRMDDRYVKEDVVRTLSVPWAKSALPVLLAEYRVGDKENLGLRWAIGNALEVVADDSVFDDIVELARDPSSGRAREMVVAALGNMRDPRAVEILLELLADDAVSGYAAMGLGKLRAAVARPFILPLLEHPERWVRQEAAKALKRIDTARRTTPS
jgi:hypothetical protein